jgi:hypothetical protein
VYALTCPCSVAVSAVASAGCREDCSAATAIWARKTDSPSYTSGNPSGNAVPCDQRNLDKPGYHKPACECPAGYQDMIDDIYEQCGDCDNTNVGDWQTHQRDNMKKLAESYGCAGAAQAAPAIFVAVAAAVGHFLN